MGRVRIVIWLILLLLSGSRWLCAQETPLREGLAAMLQYPALFNGSGTVSMLHAAPAGKNPANSNPVHAVDPAAHLAFFCKLEVMADRKTRIPFRVRLGTLDYVDRLEQKTPGAGFFTEGQRVTPPRPHAPR